MNKVTRSFYITLVVLLVSGVCYAEPIQPYYKLGDLDVTLEDAEKSVVKVLEEAGFETIGAYSPAHKGYLRSIVFTRPDLVGTLGKLTPVRTMVAALKVGLKLESGKVAVTIINPEYLFRAYTQDEFGTAKTGLMKVHNDLLAVFTGKAGFGEAVPFGGGDLDSEDLAGYHYLFGMEYFEDMIQLANTGETFESLTARIEKNLEDGVALTGLVYSIKPEGKKIALYGVAHYDKHDGELEWVPVIGSDHVAALPYELIVIDNQAFMLHGRYRIAIHWPSLTMGSFSKIVSTPRHIEEQLREVATK